MSGQPGRRWGWHRLSDRWAERLVDESGIPPGALVLDIGAGDGALTARIVARDARVVAVELHQRRAAQLRARFPRRQVVVVQTDATDLRLPRRPFWVVANPPFATTTAVLRRLLGAGSRLEAADLVVPRHVARRWSGARAPGSDRWRRTFTITTGRHVPRHTFDPPATHECVVLRIRRRRTTTPPGSGVR